MSLQIEIDRLKANPTGEWLKGPRIATEDVRRGQGSIQHITAAEFFGIGNGTGKTVAVAGGQVAAQPQVAHIMRFGKRKGQLMADVKREDPGYWNWLLREVASFPAQAKKAGLLED